MDKQAVFNTVAKHLLTQGRQAMDSGGHCVYRGKDGLRCAIGALIPDEVYDPVIEDATSHMLVIAGLGREQDPACAHGGTRSPAFAAAGKGLVDALGITDEDALDDVVFLGNLQNIHDWAADVAASDGRAPLIAYWRKLLLDFGQQHSLDTSVLDEVPSDAART